jgi:hypothetical protein
MDEELMGDPDTPRNSDQGNSRAESGLLSRLRKPRDLKDDSELREHIYDSYNWLRIGMAVTAFAFPLLLMGWGKLRFGLQLQGEMSAYYWATPGGDPAVDPPMRVWFVGLIFAIGSFLFLYKGYSVVEELALDFAAILLILVALVPMCGSGDGQCPSWSVWHGRFAILFFIIIALFATYDSFLGAREARASTSLGNFRIWYGIAGILMIALPVLAAVLHHYFLGRADTLTFWVQAFGIWAFCLYWSIKTWELRKAVARRDLGINPRGRLWRGR